MWTQIFIVSDSISVRRLKELEDKLELYGALPVSPFGTPVIENGEYEVRILFSTPAVEAIVRSIITASGAIITRVVSNE